VKTVHCALLFGSLALAGLSEPIHAQAATAVGNPGAPAADATQLPGDNPPPRGMRGPPPGGTGGRPPPEAGTTAPGPSLALAIEAAQAAIAACAADGYKVGASVIDSSGQPRAALSADGANGGHVYTGVRKGLVALAFNEPTSQVSAQADGDKSVQARIMPNMAPMAGAVPLRAGDRLIGAIGVSGASSVQDEKCALAGAEKIKQGLNDSGSASAGGAVK
jgi:uncharacterized protein GlcG (DUF336 family)